MASPEEAVTLTTRGKIAIIQMNQPKKLNAMTLDYYYRIASLLREVARRNDILVTVLTGSGRFFSAGADVTSSREVGEGEDVRRHWLRSFVTNNLEITHAFYTHPKILVSALNGPAVGLSAAITAFSDFVYAMPHSYLLTPFTSLGLVAEGGASRAFVERLGISKANEALIMSKRITCEELVQVGYVNKVFDTGKDDSKFLEAVLGEINERLGDHLNGESVLLVKALIRKPEMEVHDKQVLAEVLGGLERFVSGAPQEEFKKIVSGQKKHKL